MLFYINNDEKTELKRVKRTNLASIGWKEKDLENLISENVITLIPENQLMILTQERRGQEEADILALDEEGNLYIFELKRWEGNPENLLQVLRYGQIFGQYTYERLERLFQNYQKTDKSLAEKHYEYFNETIDKKLNHHDFNRHQKFLVITDGTDLETLNAIKYWREKGLDLESIVYRIYDIEGKFVLEFDPYNPKEEVLLEEENGNFIVNTNITWSESNYREMLDEGKAAGYYDRKHGIANIRKKDKIFLYHTGVGIVAYGVATSGCKKKNIGEDVDEEFYVDVKFDWKIDPINEGSRAVKAYEINNILNSGHRFRQTCFSITDEMKETIIKISQSK